MLNSFDYTSPPLGIGYIASYLKKYGNHNVRIHDGLLKDSRIPDFETVLSSFSPDVVGISGQTTPSIYDVYRTAKVVKNHNKTIPVVVGGAHVTFQDEQVLNDCPDIDVVVRGEGEITMNAILERMEKKQQYDGVPGTTVRRGDSIIKNPDMPYIDCLDNLPFPDYDLLDLRSYFPKNQRIAPMITSRGCPYQCTFCSSSRITGKRWRGRSPENVMQEIELLQKRYGVRDVTFIDDLFTFDHKRVKEICSKMIMDMDEVTWTCSTRADILSRHPEMANWLKKAGCHTLYIGAESGSQRILDRIKKGIQLNQIIRSVKLAKQAGLGLVLSFILGIPGESKEDIESTIDFACRLDPDLAQFTICTPYPGTPMYDEVRENGWLTASNWSEFTVLEPVMEFPELSREVIKRLLTRAYYKFYTRPCLIWKQIKMKNLEFFKVAFRSILNRYRN
ncbi:MAG: B12-binding domain-containing radical SAM protein [Candidatus Thorarchaeota archaeon]